METERQPETGAEPKRDVRLAVTRIQLTNFRSYASAELVVSGRPVVLAGPNGAGKTNVLDAISLLAPGRGLRGAKLSEHIRRGPQLCAQAKCEAVRRPGAQPIEKLPSEALWAVAATVTRGGETYEIGTGLSIGPGGGERRQVRLNGVPASSSADLGDVVQMTWLTPAMDRLFSEGASGRRRFVDRLVLGFDPAHGRRAVRYETAMRERAKLLKYGPRDPMWLDGLEREMAEAGAALAQARSETVARLNAMLAERGEAGAFPQAQLAMEGETDALVAEAGADAENALRDAFARARIADAESGHTTKGPQRSDLAVRHVVKRADARECSTGEQKALLVSIILADAWELSRRRDGKAPLLLLDEVAAHLDGRRRAALFAEILSLGAQAWMTGTDLNLFNNLEGRADVFIVDNGRFTVQE
ncbi:DNA replication/repair protein RecF [Rhizomicrobium electricum]|uniref:DNA replication and repair protein RecF n=1 Tax=Rhizomicrobium electricum TaxID=480070 RepID=A0ABN1E3V5_9PROT|nr:DNA replication/repair protein RecF [Rhizomicrobium electricum]NIJ47581.1 DNA replication and repair protein RecF [Rhizomicrobium electricum]